MTPDASVPPSDPGIELRVSIKGVPFILADSARLHYIAKFGMSLPNEEGWHELLSGAFSGVIGDGTPGGSFASGALSIHIRPVMTSAAGVAPGYSDETFTCPTCKRTSHHPEDLRHGWCSACQAFTGDPRGLGMGPS